MPRNEWETKVQVEQIGTKTQNSVSYNLHNNHDGTRMRFVGNRERSNLQGTVYDGLVMTHEVRFTSIVVAPSSAPDTKTKSPASAS